MKLKPSILRDLASSDSAIVAGETGDGNCLLSPDDTTFLEDEVQRIMLKVDQESLQNRLTSSKLVTGVVMAVLGHEPSTDRGSFIVEDFLFVEPQPERPIQPHTVKKAVQTCTEFASTGPWLALVSGLGFTGTGPTSPGHAMNLQLLADWLRRSGNWARSVVSDATGVVRLVILGDSIRISTGSEARNLWISSVDSWGISPEARYLTRNIEAESVTAMARLDQWLSTLPLGPGNGATSNGLAVDLLPGPADPTSQLLPQQPIHAVAFPLGVARSGGFGSQALCGRTNPYSFTLEGRKILATAGQGINDLALYTNISEPCKRMEATLLWGHIAPTCPDTLAGYPMVAEDQLVIRPDPQNPTCSPDYPDIYVAGCQPGSDASWSRANLHWDETDQKGALLVAVPRFDVAFQLVLVHLHSLDCRVIRFDTSLLDEC
ncbi:unnamed protein product [Echinostoma caproni]|uniref:DNA_pol_E_B domain-containing protein n=1 Tax=Echinostoma caproni TaxID=27848 RepID=A0A183A9G7_9TREM|nr:unnamed protein product [Echinostoma caproni]